jgi:hypothetical protein
MIVAAHSKMRRREHGAATMTRLSIMRFLEMTSLEEERGPIMRGMCLLMDAYEHLKETSPQSEENTLAMQHISSIIGPMEDENKALSQRSGDLWRAVLELDGPELTSKEIEREQSNVATGIDWLERAIRRVAESWPVEEGGEDILMQIADLRGQLSHEESALDEAQRKYQMARAEILARGRYGKN